MEPIKPGLRLAIGDNQPAEIWEIWGARRLPFLINCSSAKSAAPSVTSWLPFKRPMDRPTQIDERLLGRWSIIASCLYIDDTKIKAINVRKPRII